MASVDELAAQLGTSAERLRTVVKQAIKRLAHQHYYVFRITAQGQAERPPSNRPRTIAAFPTPDDALAFAQRNGYGSNAQLRRVAAADLLARMLEDSGIEAIMFQREMSNAPTRGFGPGIKLTRAALLDQLRAADLPTDQPSAPRELSAAQYDSLHFGVDFTERAEFRVALAQAVEDIVATYEPPAGSIDRGPRSIFATTAVEIWLKTHGFPHAHQRRWIDVAGDPMWGGALELCEIDAGTQNHLLIQFFIYEDETGRQYIKRINVTP